MRLFPVVILGIWTLPTCKFIACIEIACSTLARVVQNRISQLSLCRRARTPLHLRYRREALTYLTHVNI